MVCPREPVSRPDAPHRVATVGVVLTKNQEGIEVWPMRALYVAGALIVAVVATAILIGYWSR